MLTFAPKYSAGTLAQRRFDITFANSNGISFGLNTNGVVTASVAAAGGSINVSAGTTSNNLTNLVFNNGNGVSFGLNGSTITASVATSLTNIRVSAGTTSNLLSAVTFANSNGITFGLDASTITASHNGLTSQSNQALSGSNGSFNFQTATFGNLNGLSFYTSNGSLVGSYTVPTQSNQTIGLYMSSNTTSSVSSGTVDARSVTFRGAGIASVGYSGGEVVISVPAGGGAGDGGVFLAAGTRTAVTDNTVLFDNANGVTFGLNAVGGSVMTASIATSLTNIKVSAGTLSNNLSDITFADSNGVSFGLNGSTITASVVPANTAVQYNPIGPAAFYQAAQFGQGTLAVQPLYFPHVKHDRAVFPVSMSYATNSTGSFTLSVWMGLYTKNVSTLSLAYSASTSQGFTFSGTANSSILSGGRLFTMGWTNTIPESNYYVAFVSRTTSGGANCSISHMIASQVVQSYSGHLGVASASSIQRELGQGVYTASTSAIPNSIAFSQLTAGSTAFRPLVFHVVSGTA